MFLLNSAGLLLYQTTSIFGILRLHEVLEMNVVTLEVLNQSLALRLDFDCTRMSRLALTHPLIHFALENAFRLHSQNRAINSGRKSVKRS